MSFPPRGEVVLSRRAVHSIVAASWVLPAVTFAATYAISSEDSLTHHTISMLSASIDYEPASCVGTFGLALSLISFALVVVLRYCFVKGRVEDAMVVGVHRKAVIGLLASVGGFGVISFQEHAIKAAHFSSAAVFFLGALVYVASSTNRRTVSDVVFKYRLAFAICAVVAFVGMGIAHAAAHGTSAKYQASATGEILCFVFLQCWLCTVHCELTQGFVLSAAATREDLYDSLLLTSDKSSPAPPARPLVALGQ